MATLYITEFSNQARDAGGFLAGGVPQMPAVATQTVAIGAGSVASAAFNSATKMIRVHADAICSVKIGGTNPTAAATDMRMAANSPPEYFGVTAGDKLAVIQNT